MANCGLGASVWRGATKRDAAEIRVFRGPGSEAFPRLGFLIKSDMDQTPHLLWELPPEVRRSLGHGTTNDLTSSRAAGSSHD